MILIENGEASMKLTWLNNGFICKELYAPYVVPKDNDYLKDLSEKYSLLLKQAMKSGADIESM